MIFVYYRFFDTNSISKITSRFSGDINIIDDVSDFFSTVSCYQWSMHCVLCIYVYAWKESSIPLIVILSFACYFCDNY